MKPPPVLCADHTGGGRHELLSCVHVLAVPKNSVSSHGGRFPSADDGPQ